MNRRLQTLTWGAVPLLVLAGLVSMDRIPGTDIQLTVPYAAEGPGPTFNTLGDLDGMDIVEITGADTDEVEGNLNMTTVSVRTNMTLSQAMYRWLFTGDTVVPIEQIFPPNHSPEDIQESNRLAFTSSEASATIAAMNYLDMPVLIEVAAVVEGSAADGIIEDGDIITAVDGQPVETPGQVQELVRGKAIGDVVALSIDRGGVSRGERIALGANPQDESVPMLGVSMTSTPAGDVNVAYNLEDIGGPSAGMMFSLAVVDKLSPGALNGGKFVAGTGTIAEDGTVGPIGGIVHKVEAANDLGADVFLAPSANCAEATSRDHGDMTVLKVDTLTDAIDQMQAFADGGEVVTCD